MVRAGAERPAASREQRGVEPFGDVPRSGGEDRAGQVEYSGGRTSDETVNDMENPRPDEGGRRRGRRAAPPTGPVGPLETAAAAVAAALTAGRAGLVAARARADEAVAAFRAGPVLPWISAHRPLVLFGGALLVSTLAIGGSIAMIAQPPAPTAGGGIAEDDPARPQPGSGFTMPSPAPTTPAPSPTPTPTPSPADAPGAGDADPPVVAPEPADETLAPTTDAVTDSNGRPDPPGATNRPDKPKD